MRRIALQALLALVPVSACSHAAPQQEPPKPKSDVRPVAKKLDYVAHVEALKKRLPHEDFHIVVQEPFVVIGDESRAMVARRARETVKWSVDLLKKDFFPADPDHIIEVWLFKDKRSYQKHTRALFKIVPSTPFGFYSAEKRALIMNIATGGGTLVHEIVHPFVAANFPNCPAWFNEGLGSLFEQCKERDERITGLTNWRLAGLQKAIEKGTVPSFERLLSTTHDEFYNRDRGTNYAQARYLCYYLQEKGLLRAYYRKFLAARAKDPTGFATLKQVLRCEDMAQFQKDWERYVTRLRF